MKKQIISLSLLFVVGINHAQTTPTENYIKTTTCLDADCVKKSETVKYFDGLGRPKQVVNVKATPTGKDVVIHIEYDEFGRQVKDYLPIPQSGTQNGGIYTDPLSSASAVYGNEKIYAEKILESSPLNRLQEQIQVGEDWIDHPVQFNYDTNVNNEVKRYITTTTWQNGATTSILTLSTANNGYYGENQLYKNTVTDEDGNQSIEFKNGQGQTLLVRKKNGTQNVDTYYVYNEYDQLAFVISPKASLAPLISPAELDALCYQYRYDGRNRLVEKKLPGKGWEYLVYDQQDRLIMTQDANLKAEGKWLFTKYDQFSRVAYTGITMAESRNSVQTFLNESSGLLAQNNVLRISRIGFTKNGMDVYYENNTSKNYPNNIVALLNVNYYDTYPIESPEIPSQVFNQAIITADAQNNDISTKSLPTATYLKNVEDDGWTRNYIFYDERGRVIGNESYNHLGGNTRVYSELNFSGTVKRSNTYHQRKTTDQKIIIRQYYSYDFQNRLIRLLHKVNDNPTEVVLRNYYNELGQLQKKKVGGAYQANYQSLQEIDYKYNIRGWMTGINKAQINNLGNKLFAYQIDYNTPNLISLSPAKYNGNIAQVSWNVNDKLKRYHYQYDGLNRLSNAIFTEPNATNPINHYYDESLTYDLNGNIQTLKRNARPYTGTTPELIDDLHYTYNGNRLTKLEDATNNQNGYEGGGNIISYDTNGNMVAMLDKEINSIHYNVLNLPIAINMNNGDYAISHTYRADGIKLKKISTINENGDYVNRISEYLNGFHYASKTESIADLELDIVGFVYNQDAFIYEDLQLTPDLELKFVPTTEGFYDFEKNEYIYQYKDHLGNARVTYDKNMQIVDANNYYPFGMNHLRDDAPSNFGQGSYKNYKYNGKELQEMGMYDYGARFYMPDVGRWGVVDPLAEKMPSWSPYAYVFDNPINLIDPTGMEPEWIKNSDGTYTAQKGDSAWSLHKQAGISFHKAKELLKNQGKTNLKVSDVIRVDEKITDITIESTLKTTNILANTEKRNYNLSKISKGNNAFSLFTAGIGAIPGSFRFSTTKQGFSPKYYASSWKGNQYVKTFNIGKFGGLLGKGAFGLGVLLDGVGVQKYYKNPYDPNSVHPAKMGVNTFMGGLGFTGFGTPVSFLYGGLEVFYPNGAKGALKDYGNIQSTYRKYNNGAVLKPIQ